MYEPPKSNLEKYIRATNACPKCHKEINLWDYIKPGARKANSIKCQDCLSTLRYNLSPIESFMFVVLGFLVAIVPAYFVWSTQNTVDFALHYLPIVIPLWLAIGPLEGWYVRKFKKVVLVNEITNN